MQLLEGSGVPVLYTGRTDLKVNYVISSIWCKRPEHIYSERFRSASTNIENVSFIECVNKQNMRDA